MRNQILVPISCGLAAIFFSMTASAQHPFVKSHGKFLAGALEPVPSFRLDASYQPNVGTEDSNVEADLAKVQAHLFKAFPLNADVAILSEFHYGLRDYQFNGIGPLETDLDESLHEISLVIGANWFATKRFLLTAVFRPGIFSDLDGSLGSDDFRWRGNVLGTHQLSEHWFVGLGVAVTEDFDETNVIPMGGFTWVPHDQLRVDVLLPRSATITWRPWGDHTLSIVPGLHLEGQQYHVQVGGLEGDIHIQDIRADITTTYEVTPGAETSLSIGSNFRGKYEVNPQNGLEQSADQDPSFYVAIGFKAYFRTLARAGRH